MAFFGTDGIRGIFGQPPLTTECLQRIGYAVKTFLPESAHIVLGWDTRASCQDIQRLLCAQWKGLSVITVGIAPTPAVAFLTKQYHAHLGVMISASHNPHIYNGLKFFTSEGSKLSVEQETQLEALCHKDIPSPDKGQAIVFDRPLTPYITHLVTRTRPLAGLRVVLDCAHGAFYQIAEQVFTQCGAKVMKVLGNTPDGKNINDQSGSLHPEKLQHAVCETGSDLGLAFDGDGDRVIIVDDTGIIHDGDQIIAALCHNATKGVVGTVVSNMGLETFCASKNIPFLRTAVGDKFVAQTLSEKQWDLGGESCGHIVLTDHLSTGDGLAAGLAVASLLVEQKTKASTLFPLFVPLPSITHTVHAKKDVLDHPQIRQKMAFLEKKLSPHGRLLVRPSGTEPVIRILIEGENIFDWQEDVQELVRLIDTHSCFSQTA